jgi:hypothetical protein
VPANYLEIKIMKSTYIFLATLAAVALGFTYYGYSKTCTVWGAHNAIKAAVLNELKSPSSADFGSTTNVEKIYNCAYKISGVVDSQNSFGAIIRSGYTGQVIGTDYHVMWVSVEK